MKELRREISHKQTGKGTENSLGWQGFVKEKSLKKQY